MSSSTNDFQGILQSFVLFGVISLFVYFGLLRRRDADLASPATAAAARVPTVAPPDTRPQEKPSATLKSTCTRFPPHLSEASSKITQSGGSNVLSDGMIAFRHNKVASHEATLSPEVQIRNRKERAKVLSNLLADSKGAVTSPPVKGGAIALAIPVEDLDCEKLRRVVYLLATYYSLLVIVTVDSSMEPKEMKDVVQRLRGPADDPTYLAPEILPHHRITASSSATGRVAFVRQLQRIELVLDFDAEVKDSLSRFGHRVILYGSSYEKETSESRSRLGVALL